MYHLLFEEHSSYNIAVLVKTDALRTEEVKRYYVDPMVQQGIPLKNFVAFSLEYGGAKKPSATYMKEYLTTSLLPELSGLGVKYIYCTDGNYFKALTKKPKAEPYLGYVLPCAIAGYEYMQVVLSMNHKAIFANDSVQDKITRANSTMVSCIGGTYTDPGIGIINSTRYIASDVEAIKAELTKLLDYPKLTADIETFSLRHTKAKLGTIAFAWDKHNGIAIDILHKESTLGFPEWKQRHKPILDVLRWFFETYTGTLIWHNCTYDMKVLIYVLYMKNLTDTEGLLRGLEVMTKNFEDTKIITYLATNTCSENPLGLKYRAHEFAGNYAQDEINDITLISSPKLLEYNLVDCLSTWYVHDKYYPLMVADEQEEVYKTLFKPMLVQIIQMELTGMPLNMERVKEVDKELEAIINDNFQVLHNSKLIQDFSYDMREKELIKRNNKLKKKVLAIDNIEWTFNPNSNQQLADLLHGFIGFEVLSTTKTGQPSVGGDELKGHLHRTENQEIKDVIQAIIYILEGVKIRGTFVSKFLEADEYDGWHYLFGSFHVGGTKSGRLSSSDPNMQNIPSGSTYGKMIKSCFQAPSGWLFVGLDFASLEDRINTLLTKDPNKEKVYSDGFDGHSFRAVSYWPDKFVGLDITDPKQVNGIAHIPEGSKLRQKSKAPTFALTYQGTYSTLMKNCGFTEQEAKSIEANYHKLYAVSTAWVQGKLQSAANDGYVTLAFGLRLRTPILHKTILGSKFTPQQAAAESRTAGNAVSGQSYGLLNSRAGVEFQRRTIQSKHRLDIRPCAHIHDAQYFMIRNTVEVVHWLNDVLVECVSWQELPEIKSDVVKLFGELDIFYPTWKDGITIPNHASPKEIYNICKEHHE